MRKLVRITALLKSRRLVPVAAIACAASVFLWAGLSELMLLRARSSLRVGGTQNALVNIEWFERIRSSSGESRFLAGRCHRRLGDMASAKRCLDAAAGLGYAPTLIQRERWLILAQIGAISEVESHLQSLLVSPGDDAAEICEAYVSGFLVNYQFGKAIGLLEAWQADFPDDARPWFIRGQCMEHLANSSSAANAYDRALELDATRDDIRRALVRTLLELHRYDECQKHVSVLLETSEEDADTLSLAGEIHRQTARTEDAESYYRRALTHAPRHHQARVGLIRVLLSLEETIEACGLAEELVIDHPRNSEACFLLLQALRMAQRKQEARELAVRYDDLQREQNRARLLMEKVRERPDDPELRFEIGSILLEYGDRDDAMTWLRSVLELAPRHTQARAILEQLAE